MAVRVISPTSIMKYMPSNNWLRISHSLRVSLLSFNSVWSVSSLSTLSGLDDQNTQSGKSLSEKRPNCRAQ